MSSARWTPIILLLLAAVAVSASPADAAFPGRNGRLFFTGGGRGLPQGVYSLSARPGARPRPVVTCPKLPAACVDVGSVAVAPDGRRLAFVASGHIYLASTDGKGLRRVPDLKVPNSGEPIGPGALTWAPRGDRLAVSGDYEVAPLPEPGGGEPAFQSVVLVADLAGSIRALTGVPALTALRWSALGRLVSSGPCMFNVVRVGRALNATCVKSHTGASLRAAVPDWSPDGKAIVYDRPSSSSPSGRDVDLISLRARVPRRVTADGVAPVWSPDGRSFAFLRGPVIRPASIWITGRSHHRPRRIATVHSGWITSLDWQAVPTRRRGRR